MTATAAITATVVTRTQFKPPQLAPLTKGTPRKGLLLSAILHAASVSLMVWRPISFQAQPITVVTAADLLRDPNYHVIMLPALPPMPGAGSGAHTEHLSKHTAHIIAETGPTSSPRTSVIQALDYAGPQEIVSDLPDSTNSVQTIRRPDLVAPPNLKFPIRLPSLVMLPPPAAPALIAPQSVAPQVEQSVQPLPEVAITTQPSIASPTMPVTIPKQPTVTAEQSAPPKITDVSDQSLPVNAVSSDLSAPKAVVVINAVSVPAEPVPPIPDAELAGSFVVAPSKDVGATSVGATGTELQSVRGDDAGLDASNAGRYPSRISLGSGPGVDAGSDTAGVARAGYPSSVGTQPGSGGSKGTGAGTGTVTGTSAGNGGLPGISISGGLPGRSGRAVVTSSIPRNPYALTIVSGGSSGGASRDLGVFGRSETVYTVYIPMADAGGGPDWSMEYALMNSDHAGNGLLAPPVAVKKIQAIAPKTDLTANPALVFVTGIIDEKGMPLALRAILALGARSQSAVSALSQWEFRPAQLDGNPVASKVLIGVTVIPAEDARKQN